MNRNWHRLFALAGMLLLAVWLPACSDDDEDSPTGPGGGGDTTAPTVAATSPAGGATDVSDSAPVTVTFSEAMDPATDDGHVTLSHGAITSQTWSDDRTLTIAHEDWPQATQITLTVGTGLADTSGNHLAAAFTASFWTESETLAFLESDPPDGAVGVNRDASIRLLFSHEMDTSSLESGITISDVGKAEFAFTVSGGEDNRYTLDPAERLPANTEIFVNLTTAVQTEGGENLAEPVTVSFTTGDTVDETPPTIVGFEPASGSTVPLDQGFVRITFSEPIDGDTLTPESLNGQLAWILAQAGTEPSWNPDGTVLTVALPATLPAGTPLAVTFSGYADVNGNVQTGSSAWEATTAGTADHFPVSDGLALQYYGSFARGDLGDTDPTEEGVTSEYMLVEGRPGEGEFNLWNYADPDYNTPQDYEVYAISPGGVAWIGFAEDMGGGDLTEVLFTDPLTVVSYPLQAGRTWTSTSSVVLPDGTYSATLEGEIMARGDLPAPIFGDDPPIHWSDVWPVHTVLTVQTDQGEDFFREEATRWLAPGVGLVRHQTRGEDYPPQEETGWEELDLWLVPFGLVER